MAPRSEEKTELKCRECEEIFPAGQFTYSQKRKKYRRRCPRCVALSLYLRGDGPKPADAPVAQQLPEEYGRIELATQLLPPQKLSGVSHIETIVVEPVASGPGQRRARTERTVEPAHASYQNSQPKHAQRKARRERDVAEELIDMEQGSVHSVRIDEASSKSFKASKKGQKPGHSRQLSSSEQARALYMKQLKGRRNLRASRDFDNEEEEQPELLKGEKGRKRLSVLDGGYPRESMKPGPERVIGQ